MNRALKELIRIGERSRFEFQREGAPRKIAEGMRGYHESELGLVGEDNRFLVRPWKATRL